MNEAWKMGQARVSDIPCRSVSDFTFELGVSQQSVLTRAFRRWAGKSPSDWRRYQAAGSHS